MPKTYEEIKNDALDSIPDTLDKRQGSFIDDAISPFASELAQFNVELETAQDMGFLYTSAGEYLDRLCEQFGTSRIVATQSIGEAVFDRDIPIGTRFSLADTDVNFVAVKYLRDTIWGDGDGIEAKVFELECEQTGTDGNIIGMLIPIDFTISLGVSYLQEITYRAIDDETDDELRDRTLRFIQRPHLDGNVAQYLYWADQYPGIGECFVERDPANINGVNVYIADENGGQASARLVEEYQKFLDPGANGFGLGQAPIGAVVKVRTLTEVLVTIEVKVIMDDPTKVNVVQDKTRKAIEDYIRKEANKEKAIKSYEIAKIVDDNQPTVKVAYVKINGQDVLVKDIAQKESATLTSYKVVV